MTDIALEAEATPQGLRGLTNPDAGRPPSLPAEDGASPAFLSRCLVLQAIGGAVIAGLWTAGIAGKPFEGDNAFLCWVIVGMGVLGIICVFRRRWNDVQCVATHVVRVWILGTVAGLI